MAAITTRQTAGTGATVAGVPLTNAQIDQNFINLNSELVGKQDQLVSGTTIKTINGVSVLGSGNLVIDPGITGVTSFNTRTGAVTLTGTDVTSALGFIPTDNLGTVTSISITGGTTGLTFTGSPITSSGTVTLQGTLAVANGGTGATNAGDALTSLGAQPTLVSGTNIKTINGSSVLGSGDLLVKSGLEYVTKTANYTATTNQGILANTSGGSFVVTLPSTPSSGDQVVVADATNSFSTNNLTIARNGSTIEGLAEDLVLDVSSAVVQLVYDGTTWQAFTQLVTGTGVLTSQQVTTALGYTPYNPTNVLGVTSGGTGAITLIGYVKGSGTSALTASATIPGSDISGNISGNAANVTGTVAVANGGTGATTLTANSVLLGNGTSALQAVAPGTSGNVLTSNGTTWASAALAATNITNTPTGGIAATTVQAAINELDTEKLSKTGGTMTQQLFLDLNGQEFAEAIAMRGGNGALGGSYIKLMSPSTTTTYVGHELPIVGTGGYDYVISSGAGLGFKVYTNNTTTPKLSVTSAGNIEFNSTGTRIRGDFSSATVANRTLVQNLTTNSSTDFGIIPNGTSTGSSVTVYNSSGATNASYLTMVIASNLAKIESGKIGTGTAKFLELAVGGISGLYVGTAGEVGTYAALLETQVSLGAGVSIDLKLGNYFTKTVTTTTTFTVSNVPGAGGVISFVLDLTNGGSQTVNWWAGMKWAGGTAPTLTASGRDVLGFFTHDGGTTWNGFLLAKDIK